MVIGVRACARGDRAAAAEQRSRARRPVRPPPTPLCRVLLPLTVAFRCLSFAAFFSSGSSSTATAARLPGKAWQTETVSVFYSSFRFHPICAFRFCDVRAHGYPMGAPKTTGPSGTFSGDGSCGRRPSCGFLLFIRPLYHVGRNRSHYVPARSRLRAVWCHRTTLARNAQTAPSRA